ncbi:MAG: MBL fold metallo-hydrolase [Sphingobacteriales bacterium]|nr:MAG: MBL fold metallo-hydrolase [Sphingobacteriales bacterium]
MLRRQFIKTSALSLGALTIAQQKIFAAFFDNPWKIKMLTDKLGIFSEKGGTIAFLLEKEGIVVVDAQFPDTAPHLIDELKKKSDQPFQLLINTHHHGDHTSGNIAFKGLVKNVLAHSNSKANQERVAKEKKTEDQQLYPDQTFGSIWCQKAGKEQICLHYFGAGHTDGDAIIHFKHADVVHMGDLCFNRRHPFIDKSAGANIKNWIELLDKTANKFSKKTTYIFGHSGDGYEVTGTRDDLKAFGDYLGNVLKFVDGEIKAGKTKDEILKAKTFPGIGDWKGDGIERPLTAAYEELTAK